MPAFSAAHSGNWPFDSTPVDNGSRIFDEIDAAFAPLLRPPPT